MQYKNAFMVGTDKHGLSELTIFGEREFVKISKIMDETVQDFLSAFTSCNVEFGKIETAKKGKANEQQQ